MRAIYISCIVLVFLACRDIGPARYGRISLYCKDNRIRATGKNPGIDAALSEWLQIFLKMKQKKVKIILISYLHMRFFVI